MKRLAIILIRFLVSGMLLFMMLPGCSAYTDMRKPTNFYKLIKTTYPELRIWQYEKDKFMVFGLNEATGQYFVFTRYSPPSVLNEIR